MARTKEPLVSEAILHLLRQRRIEAPPLPPGSAKYPQMKELLRDVLSLYSPHTRLPSLRDIAGVFDTTFVTAQRALNELVNEGLLYSKERSGIFVAAPRAEFTATPANTAPAHADSPANHFLSRFQFGTDSAAPHQQTFWSRLARDFQTGHPTTEPRLNFTTDSADFATHLDLFERSAWSRHWSADKTPLVDLADFATEDLVPLSKDGRSLPLYHRSYFLFYNPDFLRRHDIPAPAYRDFAGQAAYLQAVAPRLAALGLDPRPYSTQEPATLLGREVERFLELARAPDLDPAAVASFVAAAQPLVAFCRQCRHGNDQTSSWIEERTRFRRGDIPFFFGYSVDYWEFHAREHPFALAAYPTLCVDDALFVSPVLGAINRNSLHPAESLRFMSFIRSRPVQQALAETGNFAGNLAPDILPPVAPDPAWIRELLPRSHVFDLTAPDAFYLVINILNGELWRALLDFVSAEQSVTRALHLARSYRRHRATGDAPPATARHRA